MTSASPRGLGRFHTLRGRVAATACRPRYNGRMSSTAAARAFRLTLDLFDAGVRMMRQNLRRQDPEADEQEIERRLATWLRTRPGAEHGDCSGRAVDADARLG